MVWQLQLNEIISQAMLASDQGVITFMILKAMQYPRIAFALRSTLCLTRLRCSRLQQTSSNPQQPSSWFMTPAADTRGSGS